MAGGYPKSLRTQETRHSPQTASHGRGWYDDGRQPPLLSQTDGTGLEIKTFDAHDGQGLTLAQTAGLRTGCIAGRESAALHRRAREMKMEFVYMKQSVKMPAYEEIVEKADISDSAVAYIGDDLPDIPLM